ncbi:MAG: hypothetical protein JO307_31570 [Bryobacterales bacterium]|nr:hypothetical protein [Bryobacterales bacterium]
MPAPYEKSVFINCPYDKEFEPLFHAIILTVAALGFVPRSARETEGQSETRIKRIAIGLLQCKYSIHDLSRFQGEGNENLARFNMPLELGMALGVQYLRDQQTASSDRHNWCVLVPPNFVHQKFVSDLAGYDLLDHDGEPLTIIKRVAKWLSLQDFNMNMPSSKAIFDAYPGFCQMLEQARARLGDLIWPAIMANVEVVVAGLPL